MVTELPAAAICGVNDAITGIPEELVTVNEPVLVTVPDGEIIVIGPVVAPEGTVATRLVTDAETIAALVPLNLAVS
jgi:hypothetical protein